MLLTFNSSGYLPREIDKLKNVPLMVAKLISAFYQQYCWVLPRPCDMFGSRDKSTDFVLSVEVKGNLKGGTF